jgi:hypothetical protein
MPFMMTDVAAGSTAARTMQQNAYGAQYDQQNIAAEAQQKQLMLQKTAAETQQLQARAQLEQLQGAMTGLEIQDKEASREATQKLIKTMDPSLPLEEKLDRISAAIAPFDPKGSKELSDASSAHALKDASAQLKKNEDARQHIGNLDSVIKAIPDDKLNDVLGQLPPEELKAVTDKVGPGWAKMSPSEKKAVIHNLTESTDQKLREQNMAMQLQKQQMIDNTRLEEIRLRNNLTVLRRSAAVDAESKILFKTIDTLDKTHRDPDVIAEEKYLNEQVNKTRAEANKPNASWFGSMYVGPDKKKYQSKEAYDAYQDAIKERDDFVRKQVLADIDLVSVLPDSVKGVRDSYLNTLKNKLAAVGEPPPKTAASTTTTSETNVLSNKEPKGGGVAKGDIEDGYRFKGGDRSDPKNWEKVK